MSHNRAPTTTGAAARRRDVRRRRVMHPTIHCQQQQPPSSPTTTIAWLHASCCRLRTPSALPHHVESRARSPAHHTWLQKIECSTRPCTSSGRRIAGRPATCWRPAARHASPSPPKGPSTKPHWMPPAQGHPRQPTASSPPPRPLLCTASVRRKAPSKPMRFYIIAAQGIASGGARCRHPCARADTVQPRPKPRRARALLSGGRPARTSGHLPRQSD